MIKKIKKILNTIYFKYIARETYAEIIEEDSKDSDINENIPIN